MSDVLRGKSKPSVAAGIRRSIDAGHLIANTPPTSIRNGIKRGPYTLVHRGSYKMALAQTNGGNTTWLLMTTGNK